MGLVSSEETSKGLLCLPHEGTVRSSRLPAGRGMLPGRMRRRGRGRLAGRREGLSQGDTHIELEGKAFDARRISDARLSRLCWTAQEAKGRPEANGRKACKK